ncbi:MAG: helix-turn-helix domain-containing protein [Phycisphaerales bacterium JB043]
MNHPFDHPPQPWNSSPGPLRDAIKDVIEADAIALGILDPHTARSSCLLHAESFTTSSLARWLEGGSKQDQSYNESLTSGCAQAPSASDGLRIETAPAATHVLHVQLPMPSASCHWWLACARPHTPFTPRQRDNAIRLLQEWSSSIIAPSETDLQHMIVTSDGTPVFTGPLLSMAFDRTEESEASFVQLALGCLEQRWEDSRLDEPHDIVVPLGDNPIWITSRRRHVLDRAGTEHWLLECRSIERDELPMVGLLKDTRVARALGFIHDYYFDSPSLNDLAAHVQSSPFHFHRLFAKQVGVSPKQYLLQKQMQVGRWRLRLGLEPIGEIAVATGFANHAHFTSTFRRLHKISPSEYQLNALRRTDSLRPYGARTESRDALREKPTPDPEP